MFIAQHNKIIIICQSTKSKKTLMKGEVTMDTIKSTVRVGQKIP